MPALEEKIIQELSKHNRPVEYSQFRENFTEPDFVERLCFLISTGDVLVAGWGEERSKYPKEAEQVNRVFGQYYGIGGGVDASIGGKIKQFVSDVLKDRDRVSSALRGLDKDREPHIIYIQNLQKL